MIATDSANPHYVGAVNPDRNLVVVFSSRPIKMEFLSNKEGRPIFSDCDFVNISIPGNTLSIIDTFARDDHKTRFPIEWANYVASKDVAGESKTTGTPLDKWSLVSPAQAEELKHLKFKTVESVANASDLQLQSLGMMVGMSPFTFRDRARHFLAAFGAESVAVAEDDEKKTLRDTITEMQKQIESLSTRGPGRPKKDN
jgi:hypothetical protein